jgi:hypothetical protein
VFVSAAAFDDVVRPDLTSSVGTVDVTRVRSASLRGDPARLARFLIAAHLVRTVAHLEATVTCVEASTVNGVFRSRWAGSHVYFTSDRQERPLAFTIEVDLGTGVVRARS